MSKIEVFIKISKINNREGTIIRYSRVGEYGCESGFTVESNCITSLALRAYLTAVL